MDKTYVNIIKKIQSSILCIIIGVFFYGCADNYEGYVSEENYSDNYSRDETIKEQDDVKSSDEMTELVAEDVDDCPEIYPFCSEQQYNFPNNVDNGHAPVGPNYGCNPANELPNDIWYYFKVAKSGRIDIKIKQSSEPKGKGRGIDVDYVMWGPFTDLVEGCSKIMSGNSDPIQSSWSPDGVEYISIGGKGGSMVNVDLNRKCTEAERRKYGETILPPAKEGEIYIVVISNWDNRKGYYVFEQTNFGKPGAGSTECTIVEECTISGFSADLTVVDQTNFGIKGQIKVNNPPKEGKLMIRTCNGKEKAVASAPFTKSTFNYSLVGFEYDGKNCSVEAYFTENDCSETIQIKAPDDCNCDVPIRPKK